MSVQVVSFHCVLKNNLGQVIGTSFNQDVVVANQSHNKSLRGLVDGLKNLKAGEKRKVSLRADQAYGYYDPKLIIELYIDELDIAQPVRLGETIIYVHKGEEKSYRVISMNEDVVTLDGNHPLAGQDLIFEIEATDARTATAEDLCESDIYGQSPLIH